VWEIDLRFAPGLPPGRVDGVLPPNLYLTKTHAYFSEIAVPRVWKFFPPKVDGSAPPDLHVNFRIARKIAYRGTSPIKKRPNP
jgi:hypothetical protein